MNEVLNKAIDIPSLLSLLPEGGKVADIGCFGWRWASICAGRNLEYWGLDQQKPPYQPAQAQFAQINQDGTLMVGDEMFDVVILSHVLEHLQNPMPLVEECRRICKPGGIIWIETPSEHSILIPSYDSVQEDRFLSFWDDPTHVRPYTPMALYRIAISFNLWPIGIQRVMYGDLPSVRICAQKIDNTPMRYVTLVACQDKSLDGVWQHIWQRSIPEQSELSKRVSQVMTSR